MQKHLIRYVLETDDEDGAEFDTLPEALQAARAQDFLLQVTYRAVKTRILREPQPHIRPEIKRGDWLVLSGEGVKRFYIDLNLLDLSPEERKDPYAYRVKLYARYSDYMPFSDLDDIKMMSLQYKKYGVRVLGAIDGTTDWVLCNTMKDAKSYLLKNYKITLTDDSVAI